MGLQRVLGLGQLPKPPGLGCTSLLGEVDASRPGAQSVIDGRRSRWYETYWGAEEEGVRGRQIERKGLIAVARGGERQRAGADPYAVACATPIGGQLDALRGGVDRARQRGSHRWLAGLRATREEGLSALTSSSSRVAASRRRNCFRWCTKRSRCSSGWLLGTHQACGTATSDLDYYLDECRLAGSTGAAHVAGASCSTGCFHCKRSLWSRRRIARSFAHWDAEPF